MTVFVVFSSNIATIVIILSNILCIYDFFVNKYFNLFKISIVLILIVWCTSKYFLYIICLLSYDMDSGGAGATAASASFILFI